MARQLETDGRCSPLGTEVIVLEKAALDVAGLLEKAERSGIVASNHGHEQAEVEEMEGIIGHELKGHERDSLPAVLDGHHDGHPGMAMAGRKIVKVDEADGNTALAEADDKAELLVGIKVGLLRGHEVGKGRSRERLGSGTGIPSRSVVLQSVKERDIGRLEGAEADMVVTENSHSELFFFKINENKDKLLHEKPLLTNGMPFAW